MLEAIPYQVHTILSDNGIQFAEQPRNRNTIISHGPRSDGGPWLALTPYEYICKLWTSEPDRFILDPIHQMPELNT